MRDVDFGWDLPPGVTQSMIDARYADADEERAIDVADGWLSADPAWWRRYVAAESRERRLCLYDARVEHDDVDVHPLNLHDWLEDERRHLIGRARQNARIGVLVARRARATV